MAHQATTSKAILSLQDERWLSTSDIADIAQTHRAASEINRIPFAVLMLELGGPIDDRINRARQITEACDQMWAHAHHVGSWTEDRACVVLPNATMEQALHYADQMRERLGQRPTALYSSDLMGRQSAAEFVVRPTFELFQQPLPRWKRLVDIVLGTMFLLAAAPVLLVLMALVKFTSRGPALFLQKRVGLGGKHFHMYKLRTMFEDAEARRDALNALNEQSGAAFKMKHDPRVTPIGHLLRRSSLDELPQLLNVVTGDMSLVGPRPLPVSDWEPTDARHIRRHDVTPGISCTWQVSGRSEIPFDEWMEMDLRYAANTTLLGDLLILCKTVVAVLSGKGAV